MVKRIILLLDGTWNDIDAGPADTNIVRMRGLISRHLVRVSGHGHSGEGGEDKKVHGYTKSGKEHIIYYERGVGTGAFDRFRGRRLWRGADAEHPARLQVPLVLVRAGRRNLRLRVFAWRLYHAIPGRISRLRGPVTAGQL